MNERKWHRIPITRARGLPRLVFCPWQHSVRSAEFRYSWFSYPIFPASHCDTCSPNCMHISYKFNSTKTFSNVERKFGWCWTDWRLGWSKTNWGRITKIVGKMEQSSCVWKLVQFNCMQIYYAKLGYLPPLYEWTFIYNRMTGWGNKQK